jgi:small subunit ribosomal protein S16
MPVKIRLTRMGKKKQPTYRVVVVDSRKPRDGAHIEQIGRYDPRQEPSIVEIDNDRAMKWLQDGAQPSDRVRKLLEISGAWARFRVARGDIHTIDDTPQPEEAVAEEAAPEEAAPEEAAPEEAVPEEPVTEDPVAEAAPDTDEPDEDAGPSDAAAGAEASAEESAGGAAEEGEPGEEPS